MYMYMCIMLIMNNIIIIYIYRSIIFIEHMFICNFAYVLSGLLNIIIVCTFDIVFPRGGNRESSSKPSLLSFEINTLIS